MANPNTALVTKLLLIVVGMFGFGFALVPLYDVFCDITGINGKTRDTAAVYYDGQIDESRTVTVEFITRTHTGMPWEFRAQTHKVKVHPGEMNMVEFYVRNPVGKAMVAQAIPSVTPGQAALFLNKTECFCFNSQPLAAGAETLMPMRFYVDPQLPEDIHFFTVQYTLFDVTGNGDNNNPINNPFLTSFTAN
ncbi:cytochrome c oxidase assembly protein [Alteromonas lipolytica]|uniref:Cytochrome c oxidase assembly protein CtaG n=1 Tax=Alteromonas lipolytica TaxID=1856405 RepID=A0A1E8FBQ9_9ALTE|nr:cytochrome c oxidase assembly protein [Alteromonas lipolytica]OFI33038.1 cytochrome c oxidase assembly protein [Alteromonas lipolytica]GGF63098.1 cytochrome c oxidase assembly protein [Alteromonas lipolytica]